MKNLLLTILCFSFVQLANGQRWTGGLSIAGGINGKYTEAHNQHEYAGGSWTNSVTTGTHLQSAFGVWASYALSPKLSIQTGLEYQFLTASKKYDYRQYDAQELPSHFLETYSNWDQDWMNIPLAVRYYFSPPTSSCSIFLEGGIQGNFLHQVENRKVQFQTTTAEETTNDRSIAVDINSEAFPYRRWNITPTIGVGLQIGRVAIQCSYIGRFQAYDIEALEKIEYHLQPYPVLGRPGFPLPPIERGDRLRVPDSLRLQLSFKLF